MAGREVIARDLDDIEVIKLILAEEEKERPPVAPPKARIVPVGTIGLALEEIERGSTGLVAFPGIGRVEVLALSLIHQYASVLVVTEPNVVIEFGAQSASIKAPTRSMEDINDVAATVDKTITVAEEVDVFRLLGQRAPRFIRILVDQACTLEFQTPRTARTTYPEGLAANDALEITNETWTTIWVTPTTSTTLQIYMSTTSAMGKE